MSFQLEFELADDHIIVDISGRKALIDTGSPVTIGKRPLVVDERHFPVRREPTEGFLAEITAQLGVDIEWLVGGDILGQYCLEIDWAVNTLFFCDDRRQRIEGVPLLTVSGIPVIKINLNGKEVLAYFDTGAKISYANESLVEMLSVTGRAKDFYPGHESFETELRTVRCELVNVGFEISCGVLPAALQSMVSGKISAIIGADFFKTFPWVMIDYTSQRFVASHRKRDDVSCAPR